MLCYSSRLSRNLILLLNAKWYTQNTICFLKKHVFRSSFYSCS